MMDQFQVLNLTGVRVLCIFDPTAPVLLFTGQFQPLRVLKG